MVKFQSNKDQDDELKSGQLIDNGVYSIEKPTDYNREMSINAIADGRGES